MTTATELQDLLHNQIPLSAAMGLTVRALNGRSLTLSAPLAANHNHAGTMFAGSQHALASLAGWGLLRAWADNNHWSAELVLAHADIRYLRPAAGDLEATASLDDEQLARLREARDDNGAVRLELRIDLLVDGTVCSRFTGLFAARGTASGD